VACFIDFDRAPHDAHAFGRAPCDAHDSGHATHSTGVPGVPATLLVLPSIYVGATGTASTSEVTAGKDCTSGTFGQPSSNDHEGEVELPATN
jgi:hypothetical protein